MKKIKFFIFCLFLFASNLPVYSQTDKNFEGESGIIKTQKGFLLYYNSNVPHTIYLKGKIDYSKYPILFYNSCMLEFINFPAKKILPEYKSMKTEDVLLYYMNWEMDYFMKKLHLKKLPKPEKNMFALINNLTVHFWTITNPVLKNDSLLNEKQFIADFLYKGNLFRISIYTGIKDDDKVINLMTDIIKNYTFYDTIINPYELREKVISGNFKE